MKVQLVNVRLAFADVFKATDFNSDGNFKYRSQLLIPKDSPEAKKIADAITEAGKEKYKDKWDRVKEKIKAADNLCLRDGDLKDYDGFEGQWALTATNKTRPTLVDKDRTPLVEADGKPYSGCYVNAIVDVYAYDKYGDQINCTLLGLQFAGDGDAFSGSRPASEDDFDDLSAGTDATDEVRGAALI